MAGHGFNQAIDMILTGIRRKVIPAHEGEITLRWLEWTKTKRTPSEPPRRPAARRVTPEIIAEARRLHRTTDMTQQQIASKLGLGTSGRVTEILKGQYDHLLEAAE